MNSERYLKFAIILTMCFMLSIILIREHKIVKLEEELKWWKCQPPYVQPGEPKEVE